MKSYILAVSLLLTLSIHAIAQDNRSVPSDQQSSSNNSNTIPDDLLKLADEQVKASIQKRARIVKTTPGAAETVSHNTQSSTNNPRAAAKAYAIESVTLVKFSAGQGNFSIKNSTFISTASLSAPIVNLSSPSAGISQMQQTVFSLINQKRVAAKLKPLVWQSLIEVMARTHSEDMANENYFSHTGQNGDRVSDRADAIKVKWKSIGENIAFSKGFKDPLTNAVEGWMRSHGHCENILNDGWTESAIGIAITADGKYYFTQVFVKK